mgnify:FL=1
MNSTAQPKKQVTNLAECLQLYTSQVHKTFLFIILLQTLKSVQKNFTSEKCVFVKSGEGCEKKIILANNLLHTFK